MNQKLIKTRVTVSGIIENSVGEILLCKMPKDRGAYPGQWAIPGGGIEEGERMREALQREVMEEVGLTIEGIEPFAFDDDVREKMIGDGKMMTVYMMHLVFDAKLSEGRVKMNDEFEKCGWVSPAEVGNYDLNIATRKTFIKKGWLPKE